MDEKTQKIIEQIKTEQIVLNNLLKQYLPSIEELDTTIKEIEGLIKKEEVKEIPDDIIEHYVLLLPIILYNIVDKLENIGIMGDIAEITRKKIQNDLRLNLKGTGTVAEITAQIENTTEQQQILEDVFKRNYNAIKHKIEIADTLYSALKKIATKRMIELEVFRKDKQDKDNEWKTI